MSDGHSYPLCVMFTSTDVPRSVAFYRDVLGFELEKSWPNDKDPQWANMILDKQSIMVGASGEDMGDDCAGGDFPADQMALWKRRIDDMKANKLGVGMQVYVAVEAVDEYYETIKDRGAKPLTAPCTQFYGIRDFGVNDPDGYQLVFYSTATLENCGSCGMPLTEAKPGQMYCHYCTDEQGNLRPYEAVFEGTVQGYFMGMQKMERQQAEQAAKEHLAKMPAWVGRD